MRTTDTPCPVIGRVERWSKDPLVHGTRVLGDHVFMKWSRLHDDEPTYADLGASTRCYREQRFLEVESLTPIARLEPGRQTTHYEVWQIIEMRDRPLGAVLDALPEKPERLEP